jgi:hypothetical protein
VPVAVWRNVRTVFSNIKMSEGKEKKKKEKNPTTTTNK